MGLKMEQKTFSNRASQFETENQKRETRQSEFDRLFETSNIVDESGLEQRENRKR